MQRGPACRPASPNRGEQAGFTPVIVLLGILVLTILGGGTYYFTKQAAPAVQPKITISPTPQPAKTDETAGWKTYTSTELGFSIEYPAYLSVSESTNDISRKSKVGNNIEFNFGQNSPVITIGVTKIPSNLSIQQAVEQGYSNIDGYSFLV